MDTREEKKKMLLEAASEVFLELGPHKTTLDDIAHRAGMAKTSLYYYFKSKKEIISAVRLEDQERFFDMLGRAINGKNTSEAKMCSVAETHYHFISLRVQNTSKKATLEHLSRYGMVEPLEDYYVPPLQSIIELMLEEVINKGEFRSVNNLDLVSFVITICLKDCNYLLALLNNHERVRETMRQMVQVFFTGLRMNQPWPD